MAGDFLTLVERVVARLPAPPRVVTPAEYRAITCNRCGVCCEDIPAPYAPAELIALAADPELDADKRAFLSGLEPVAPLPGGWRYRCRHFFRDERGLGTCAIHEARPAVCRGFPYGGTVRRWTTCAWYVQIVDADGVVLPKLPEADDTWHTGIRLKPWRGPDQDEEG